MDPSTILERGSEAYETSRTRFFNNGHPDRYPYQILHPRSSAEVAAAVKHAVSLGKHISVRSGGHLLPCQHLQDNEILIDMKSVNPRFEYDAETKLINFGPGLTVQDAQDFLTPRGLFFPFGHSPTVGLGGFLLAGGQGYFMQGWGMTADRWLVQIEVVTPDGDVRICNRTENADLFWAARGGGMGFFGVVTKFWGRTTRAKKLYHTHWVFSDKLYNEALNWFLDSAKLIRPHNTEVAICACYADKYTGRGDDVQTKDVVLAGAVTIYADSLEEAQNMSWPFDTCPLEPIFHLPVTETSYEELNKMQEGLMPSDEGLRYKCDSILNDPNVSRTELLQALRPIMLDLPSRRSSSVIFVCETFAPGDLAFSLPSEYYIATYLCWGQAKDDEKHRAWLEQAYQGVSQASCGTYVADFDADMRMTKIMTDKAWKKWTAIREKWDPHRRIGGFREKTEMNVLHKSHGTENGVQ